MDATLPSAARPACECSPMLVRFWEIVGAERRRKRALRMVGENVVGASAVVAERLHRQ